MTDDNMRYWDAFADIDPKFTKQITGKQYKGTSPNPQYVIRCLTELFGPVGIGFGWKVLVDGFVPLGEKTLHWCRIEFWHTDPACKFESYGQTIAAYPTNSGGFMVDEDAPKKSLTDAIIKAASHIGIAANIFLGRWDDQKYVAQVNAEYRQEERQEAPKPDIPKVSPQEIATAKEACKQCDTLDKLSTWWTGLNKFALHIAAHPDVIAAKDAQKAALTMQGAA